MTVGIDYYSFKNKKYYTISKKEIGKGDILPRDYAMFNNCISNGVNKKQRNIYGQGLSFDGDTLETNKNRLEIGLEPLQELDKKRKRGLRICKGKVCSFTTFMKLTSTDRHKILFP